jgi:NTE family protein
MRTVFSKSLLYFGLIVTINFSMSTLSYADNINSTENTITNTDTHKNVKKRPKVALVLSGGGARGFAHIGVLRVLKEMHIPIDFVVGTSMGAVVGGAYAAGRSVEDIEEMVRTTSWDSVVADRPARDALDFRRREEDILLPSRIEMAVTKNGFTFPPSAAGNAALEQALTRLLPKGMKSEPINQLPIPFRSVASDLVNGEMVELTDTPLFISLRASLAVPGMFAPVHINNRLVVDGGLVRNLPIDMARKMGADVIIAVNVGTPLATEKELGSAISVAQQMLQILTEQNVQRSLKELQADDILIAPNLAGIDFLDFDQHHNAMLAGDIATRQMAAKLKKLIVSENEYQLTEQKRSIEKQTPDKTLLLTEIEIRGNRYINPSILIAQSGLVVGEQVSEEQVRAVNGKLYARGDLDRVETSIFDQDDRRKVLIKTSEAVWGRNRLRLGLEGSTNFNDAYQFAIGAMHVAGSLNDFGAEVRTLVKVGSVREFGTQFHQPLGVANPWYIAPDYQYDASSFDLFAEGRKQARVGYKSTGFNLPLGRQISNWGDVQIGVRRHLLEKTPEIPERPENKARYYETNQYIKFNVDSLDSLAFPTRGTLFNFRWERSISNETNQRATQKSTISGMQAFRSDEWAGHLYGEWSRSQGDLAPISLGGFLRLSGTPTDSLSNKTIAFGRVVIAKRIGSMPAALGGAIRLGFSAEMGGAFNEGEAVKFSKINKSASTFVAFDTRFGPLYFGAGATKGIGSSFYLFLGPIW